MHPPTLGRLGGLPVRIDDEFVCDACVEVFVAFRHLLKIDHPDIDDLGNGGVCPKVSPARAACCFRTCVWPVCRVWTLRAGKNEAATEHGLHGKSLPGLGMLMIDGPEDSHHVAANGSGKQQVRASEPARAA